MKQQRQCSATRTTKETKVSITVNLDGKGKYKITSGIAFFDHMLAQIAKHGSIDLYISARGDDQHHIVEDVGLVLGEAINSALKNKKNINRYGYFLLPMDEALAYVAVDISGRPHLEYNVKFKPLRGGFDFTLIEDFLRAFVSTAKVTLHIRKYSGRSNHHIAESIFKALGKTLQQAIKITTQTNSIPSTKGLL